MSTGTLDITPTPRILRTIGEIPFQTWQCIAELVDNSNSETIEQSEQNTNFAEAMHSSVDTTQINNHTIDGETITPSVEANADANGDVSVPNNADTISNDSMTSASRQN